MTCPFKIARSISFHRRVSAAYVELLGDDEWFIVREPEAGMEDGKNSDHFLVGWFPTKHHELRHDRLWIVLPYLFISFLAEGVVGSFLHSDLNPT